MPIYAQIKNGRVVAVTQTAAPIAGPGLVVIDSFDVAGPGWLYDGTTFSPPPATVYERISVAAFWDRFTNAELVDYEVGMQHDPAASNAAKKDAARLRIFRRELAERGWTVLSKPRIRSFVEGLEGSILLAGRAAAILDTPITAEEAA